MLQMKLYGVILLNPKIPQPFLLILLKATGTWQGEDSLPTATYKDKCTFYSPFK